MCGIAGVLSADGAVSAELVRAMATTLRHRGPDDSGVWRDAEAGIAFGHQRLAIIDLSPAGAQPMISADGRYVLTYNGEIYNYRALARELADAGVKLRGGSDTEVLLEAIARWGLADALRRANGMFALALWDRRDRTLSLARDRLGQKPLYYGWAGRDVAFASELKALRALPDFAAELDPGAPALLLRYAMIPAPHTIYTGVWKLAAGCILTLDARDVAARRLPEPAPYWSAAAAAEAGLADSLDADAATTTEALDTLLRDAVTQCMVSDVPLGAFLSGGIDSSTVVALMQAQSARPVKTFSIGFTVPGYNEAEHAARVAAHLKTDHTELYLTPADAQAVIPQLPAIYDEPFADSSQIPTFLVSRLARQSVTVSLSGDGGDEVFGGYNRYGLAERLARLTGVPAPLRRAARGGLELLGPSTWDALGAAAAPLLPRRLRQGQLGDKLHKLAEILAVPTKEEMYLRLVSQWKAPGRALIRAGEPATILGEPARWPALDSFTQQIMLLDTLVYLPDDILVKVDRASMAVSLESRVPILDHRVVEFAWRLDAGLKVRDGQRKWILREVLARYVPRTLFERPKMGFGVPIGDWLRGDLRDWAEALLDERRLAEAGTFNATTVRRVWHEHLAGRHNHQYRLWPVLMFEAWRDAGAAMLSDDTGTAAHVAGGGTI